MRLQNGRANASGAGAAFWDMHLSISDNIVATKIAINVTILILKLSIFRFYMLMFFALHPVGVLLVSLSGLLGRLAVLLAWH